MRITEKHFGFIPDIHRIMTKYNLLYYFDQAITTGTFPTKFQWKRICSHTFHRYEQEQWNIRMSLNTDFTLLKSVHSILRPANVWIAAKARPETLPLMKFLARLCCSKQVDEIVQCT